MQTIDACSVVKYEDSLSIAWHSKINYGNDRNFFRFLLNSNITPDVEICLYYTFCVKPVYRI